MVRNMRKNLLKKEYIMIRIGKIFKGQIEERAKEEELTVSEYLRFLATKDLILNFNPFKSDTNLFQQVCIENPLNTDFKINFNPNIKDLIIESGYIDADGNYKIGKDYSDINIEEWVKEQDKSKKKINKSKKKTNKSKKKINKSKKKKEN